MARLVAAVLAVLALAAVADAQPCIECRYCNTQNCWQNCRPSCPSFQPNQVIVNGDACKRNGVMFGPNAAKQACDTTKKYCDGMNGRTFGARPPRVGATTLAQCANIALGSCQQSANSGQMGHPCGYELQRGYRQCNSQQFRSFFEGETGEYCYNFAKGITGVNPGTNQWANNNQYQPGYRPPQQGGMGGLAGQVAGTVAGSVASGVVNAIFG